MRAATRKDTQEARWRRLATGTLISSRMMTKNTLIRELLRAMAGNRSRILMEILKADAGQVLSEYVGTP
jgi:hypothetical protein